MSAEIMLNLKSYPIMLKDFVFLLGGKTESRVITTLLFLGKMLTPHYFFSIVKLPKNVKLHPSDQEDTV